MEYKVKRKTDTVAEVTINCTAAEIEGAFEKAYVRAAAKVKIPGFRPGKAPMDMVKKQLGNSVLEDAANILVVDTYNGLVASLDPKPLSQPSFKLNSFDVAKGSEFTAEYEFLPETKLSKYRKLKIEQEQPEFEESLYEPVLKKVQEEHVVMLPRDGAPAVEGDVVTLAIRIVHGKKELYKNSELDYDTSRPEVFPGLKEAVLNRKQGDAHSYEIDIDASFPDQRYAGKKVLVSFDTKDVRTRELPALDDALASQAGSFETLADLKADIKTKILSAAEDYAKGRAIDRLLDQIVEKNPFPVPAVLTENEVERLLAGLSRRLGIEEGKRISLEGLAQLTNKSVDDVRSEYEKLAESNVKHRLIIEETARLESIEVTQADLEQEMRTRLLGHGYDDQVLVEGMLEDARTRADLTSELMVKKTLDWLYQNAEVKKGEKISCKTLIDEGKIRV